MKAEQVFACAGRPRLRADVVAGVLFIRGWEGDTVRVEDCIGAEVKQKGSNIYLESSSRCSCKIYLPRNSDVFVDGTHLEIDLGGIWGEGRFDFTQGSLVAENWEGDLAVDCTGASVALRQCQGKAEIDSAGGSVDIFSSSGNFVCDTGSGSVTVRDSTGSVFADTGSGTVTVAQFSGPVHIDTGRGDVTLQSVFGRNVFADCGDGSISAILPGIVPGRWELATRSGDISLEVPENISARFEFRGKVLDVGEIHLSSQNREPHFVSGSLGRGEGAIIASSPVGKIRAYPIPPASNEVRWQVQDEESLKILRMLEQGSISIDEADKLLAALNGEARNEG